MIRIPLGLILICVNIHSTCSLPQDLVRFEDLQLDIKEDTTPTNSPLPTLPPLITYVDYGEQCDPQGVIFVSLKLCKTYDRTVACKGNRVGVPGTCECNLGEDAEFHEPWGVCVSKVDALCFLNENALGRKVCVENADCFADQEGPGHNVGKCRCLYGFVEDGAGHCIVDSEVPEQDRSSVRPTTPFPTRAPVVTGGTGEPTPETTDASPGDSGSGAATLYVSLSSLGLIMVASIYLSC